MRNHNLLGDAMFTRHSSDTATATATATAIEVAPHRHSGFWLTALGSLAAMSPVGWDGGWMFDETGRLLPEWDQNADPSIPQRTLSAS